MSYGNEIIKSGSCKTALGPLDGWSVKRVNVKGGLAHDKYE